MVSAGGDGDTGGDVEPDTSVKARRDRPVGHAGGPSSPTGSPDQSSIGHRPGLSGPTAWSPAPNRRRSSRQRLALPRPSSRAAHRVRPTRRTAQPARHHSGSTHRRTRRVARHGASRGPGPTPRPTGLGAWPNGPRSSAWTGGATSPYEYSRGQISGLSLIHISEPTRP